MKFRLFAALLLFSHFACSMPDSIKVFVTDDAPVSIENDLIDSFSIRVFNLDDLERAESKLTSIVRSKVPSEIKPGDAQLVYQDAFSEVLNGPEWTSISNELKKSTEPQEMAMRLRITKVPAVILNDKFIIYGVDELVVAIRIFQRRGLLNND